MKPRIISGILKFYRNLSIRNKLILVLYIQLLIPLVLVGCLSYRNSEKIIKDKSADYSKDILSMIQLRLSDYIDNITTVSQDLLYDKKIYSVLRDDKINTDRLNSLVYENEINSLFKKVVLSRDEIESICMVTNSGNYYYADKNSNNTSIRQILPYAGILKSARLGEGKPVWYIDSQKQKVRNIYLTRIVYNRDNFRESALLVFLVKKDFFDNVYKELTENLQNIAILSQYNEQIACRNPNDSYIFSDNLLKNLRGKKGEIIDKKNGIFVSYISLDSPQWKVVAYRYLGELYKDALTLKRSIIMLCIITALLLSVFSTFIAVDFISPIKKLVKGMEKVQKGDGIVYVPDERKDEFGFLNKTFNEMSREINHLFNWVYREQLTRKEAQLKALQSQINPHFLFNTLESINWMARLNNIPEISNTVSELSDLMEASIGRDGKLITVKEEFEYADKYVSLLKRRYGSRIQMIKKVQNAVLPIKIPRLLIQPLIENAVYHGLERIRENGLIILNARINDGMVFIEIIDNGAGIQADELVCLNECLAMDNNAYFKDLNKKSSKGIGIENVNRRIKLFYGENYGLKIKSKEGKYTKVTVSIPADKIDSEGEYYVQSIDYRR